MKKEIQEIHYTSDVCIVDHANLVVFKNFDGDTEAIYIERNEDMELTFIYTVELFKKPSDSFISKEDLVSVNKSCDTNFEFDQELDDEEQYRFTENLCWYYGAANFDSYPNEFSNYNSFVEWLQSRNLI